MTETDLVRNLNAQTIEVAQSVAMTMDAINALKNDIADIHKRLDALEGHTHGEAFGGSVF